MKFVFEEVGLKVVLAVLKCLRLRISLYSVFFEVSAVDKNVNAAKADKF